MPVRMADRWEDTKKMLHMSRTGGMSEMGIEWGRFRGQKGNSRLVFVKPLDHRKGQDSASAKRLLPTVF